MPFVGIGVGIGRQRFRGGIFAAYAARVAADGGVTEAGACVDAVSGISLNSSLLLVPSGYKSGVVYSQIPTNGDGDLTFTRASDATRVNSDGEIEVVGSGVPRLDYSQGSCPSLLLEPQRTNLLLYSEEFDNASWVKTNATINANSVIAPDGTLTGDTINISVQDVERVIQRVLVGTSISGSTYTGSIWIKGQGSNIGKLVRFRIKRNSGGTLSDVVVNHTLTSNWVRLSATFTGLTDNTGVAFGFDGATNYADSFDVWGAQLEVGAYATSYIPTTSATVTRLADTCSKTGISSLIGQTQGTLYAEVDLVNVVDGMILHISSDNDNRMGLFYRGSTNDLQIFSRVGGAFVVTINNNQSLGRHKIAAAYKLNDYVFYIDGVQVGVDTTATVPTCSIVDVGGYNNGLNFSNFINQAALFTTRLSNIELAELTTL